MDTVHRAKSALARAYVVHRTYPWPPRVIQSAATVNRSQSHVHLAEKPLQFLEINPQSQLVQNKCILVLILFTLDPVISRNSMPSPKYI